MRCFDGIRRDEKGSATIEFILWVPVIAALVVMVVQATTLYVTHTEMWNVARDTARRMVTGVVLTEDEAETYAANAIDLRDFPYCIEANYDLKSGAEVIIVLSLEDMPILGGSVLYLPLSILGVDMMARVLMRPDPLIDFKDDQEGSGNCT